MIRHTRREEKWKRPAGGELLTHKQQTRLENYNKHCSGLQDDLSETMAWTALLCDGLCGILVENGSAIDPATHSGIRYAAIWLKQRNERHAATLQAACGKLREIRGQ